MTGTIELREATPHDLQGLEVLYRQAFPEEDLVPLVRSLLTGTDPLVSFVAVSSGRLVGHVIFTLCQVEPANVSAAMLAPLCAAPDLQKKGIGSRLVRAGLVALKARDTRIVTVLGDPGYYSRFGFEPDDGITTPCPIPAEWKQAWQSLRLDGSDQALGGKLVVPDVWKDPALWSA